MKVQDSEGATVGEWRQVAKRGSVIFHNSTRSCVPEILNILWMQI